MTETVTPTRQLSRNFSSSRIDRSISVESRLNRTSVWLTRTARLSAGSSKVQRTSTWFSHRQLRDNSSVTRSWQLKSTSVGTSRTSSRTTRTCKKAPTTSTKIMHSLNGAARRFCDTMPVLQSKMHGTTINLCMSQRNFSRWTLLLHRSCLSSLTTLKVSLRLNSKAARQKKAESVAVASRHRRCRIEAQSVYLRNHKRRRICSSSSRSSCFQLQWVIHSLLSLSSSSPSSITSKLGWEWEWANSCPLLVQPCSWEGTLLLLFITSQVTNPWWWWDIKIQWPQPPQQQQVLMAFSPTIWTLLWCQASRGIIIRLPTDVINNSRGLKLSGEEVIT